MVRRPLDPRECRLILWATELDDEHNIRSDAHLHLFRQLHSGTMIAACDIADAVMHGTGIGYYSFPFIRWIAENAPVCPTCKAAMYTEGLLTDNRRLLLEEAP